MFKWTALFAGVWLAYPVRSLESWVMGSAAAFPRYTGGSNEQSVAVGEWRFFIRWRLRQAPQTPGTRWLFGALSRADTCHKTQNWYSLQNRYLHSAVLRHIHSSYWSLVCLMV